MLKDQRRQDGVVAMGWESNCFGWLFQILASAEIIEHFKAAAIWADETGCTQQDFLCHEVCLQELIEHLSLKKFPAMRLRKARDAFASSVSACGRIEDVHSVSTAASIPETKIGMAAEAACDALAGVGMEESQHGQTVLVEFDGLPYSATIQHENLNGTLRVIYEVDGTYEDVLRERVCGEVLVEAEAPVEAGADSVAEEGDTKSSKSAKKRLRKQFRQAAYTITASAQPKHGLESCRAANPLPQQSLQASSSAAVPKQNVFTEALMQVQQSTWSERREGCKARSELLIPSKCVGWVIGKNGSTIRHIEQTYLVTVHLVSQTVSVYGKHERVRQATSYIDQLLWEGLQ